MYMHPCFQGTHAHIQAPLSPIPPTTESYPSLQSNAQLDAALEFLAGTGSEPLDAAALDEAAGVGVIVTPEQISAAVAGTLAQHVPRLREERYHANTNVLLAEIRGGLPWVDLAAAKAELERQVETLLGPKTEADCVKPEKKKKIKVGGSGWRLRARRGGGGGAW